MGFRNHWRQNFGGPVEVAYEKKNGTRKKRELALLGCILLSMDNVGKHLFDMCSFYQRADTQQSDCRS